MNYIPLDRLYDFLDIIVGSDTLIYLFLPHGSKELNHLDLLKEYPLSKHELQTRPIVIHHDQEPLNWNLYSGDNSELVSRYFKNFSSQPAEIIQYFADMNLRSAVKQISNINDNVILTHSETNSKDLEQYRANGYLPVFVWSHALIARDWYRYASIDPVLDSKQPELDFLLYSRDTTGSRQYRSEFVNSVRDHNLAQHCVFSEQNSHSNNSADYNNVHYSKTRVDVVLETVIDRVHLTEKTLRPIACGQPFLLMGGKGSLDFLESYGFKTYRSFWGDYDQYEGADRQEAIVDAMKYFSDLGPRKKSQVLSNMKHDAEHNKFLFFSDTFFNKVITEYKSNFFSALDQARNTQQGQVAQGFYKLCQQHPEYKKFYLDARPSI